MTYKHTLIFFIFCGNKKKINKKIQIYIYSLKIIKQLMEEALNTPTHILCEFFKNIFKKNSKIPPKKRKKYCPPKITNISLEVALNTLTRILLEFFKILKIAFSKNPPKRCTKN